MKDSIEWMTIGIDPFRILITAAQVLTNLINIIIKGYISELFSINLE